MAKISRAWCLKVTLLLHYFINGATMASEIFRYPIHKKLAGVHIRISAFKEPPLLYIEKYANNTYYAGITKEYINLLQEILGFTYSFVEIPVNVVVDGPGIEATTIEYFLRNEFDLISRGQFLLIETFNYMDFTYPIHIGQVSFIQPMPQVEKRYLAPIKPFRLEVWVCIILSFSVTTIVISCTSSANRSKSKFYDDRPKGIRNSALFVLNVLFSQGAYFPNQRFSARLTAGSWCLAAFILVYAFNGTLVSYLTIPKYEPIVHSLQDVAESKSLRLVVGRGTPIVNMLMGSSSGYLKVLGDKLRQNPQDMIIPLMDDIYKMLHTRCCAYLEGGIFINILMYKSMMAHKGKCHLTSGRPIPYNLFLSMGIVKHFPHRSALDVGILRLWENGLGVQLWKQLYKRVDKCLVQQEERARDSRISLNDLTSGFMIFGIGLCLSHIVFLIEITFHLGKRYWKRLLI